MSGKESALLENTESFRLHIYLEYYLMRWLINTTVILL